MYNSAFRRPVSAALAIAGSALLAAAGTVPASADEGADQERSGSASATVLRTALEVSLLNGGVSLPLTVVLNEVDATTDGEHADETLLTATLDGVDDGQPFEVLRAEVAGSTAEVADTAAHAESSLTDAAVQLPGLSALPLVELDVISARAHCAVGEEPVAETTMPAAVSVLGQEVALTSEGRTEVDVPGVGQVTLTLSERRTDATSAAATALDLNVEVNPLDLNVATVTGQVTLAEAACVTPVAEETAEEPAPEGPEPQSWDERDEPTTDLAQTGGGSHTPYVIGGAAVLLALGAGTVLVARRRTAAGRNA
ncbi:SCO1860 family LAETG-anchored protein [Streptomyces sp. NBRC 109706]|uniref:SCO1860 family LAETG-anchored protein n=1 Tax=Streptomyces sp. NBRC 109706 TaxID=1550035 RepID=UPI0007864F9B|nr:SCO1860 family LAETG-anchored protein [Streptomyces sp. NBRC 109706]